MNDKYSLSFLFQGCIVGQKWKKYCNFILFTLKNVPDNQKYFFSINVIFDQTVEENSHQTKIKSMEAVLENFFFIDFFLKVLECNIFLILAYCEVP